MRVIAGSRRVRKEPSFIDQTQQIQTPLPQLQQSQAVSSTTRQLNIPLAPSQQAPPRSRSHSQIRPNESKETTFVPCDTAAPPVFAPPVYSNDLGRLPPHAQMTFGAQAHPLQSKTNSLQLDQETSYWDTSSEPPSQADTSGAGSSYRPHYPSAPVLHGLPSASEATSILQGPYGIPEIASGMLFNAMEGKAGYTQQQQTSNYGLGPMHSSIQGIESGSIVSSSRSSYKRMEVEAMPERASSHYQHQHQGIPRQHEEPALSDPLVLDNDAAAVWSNVPTGFQWVIVILFSVIIHCLPF